MTRHRLDLGPAAWGIIQELRGPAESNRQANERVLLDYYSRFRDRRVSDPLVQFHSRVHLSDREHLDKLAEDHGSGAAAIRHLIQKDRQERSMEPDEEEFKRVRQEMELLSTRLSALGDAIANRRSEKTMKIVGALEHQSNNDQHLTSEQILDTVRKEWPALRPLFRSPGVPDKWFIDQIDEYRRSKISYKDRIANQDDGIEVDP